MLATRFSLGFLLSSAEVEGKVSAWPSLSGRSSDISMYYPLHIFWASFAGIPTPLGAETGGATGGIPRNPGITGVLGPAGRPVLLMAGGGVNIG